LKEALYSNIIPTNTIVPFSDEVAYVLLGLEYGLLFGADLLVLGFWFDIIVSKSNPTLSTRTKLMTSVFSVVITVCVTAGLFLLPYQSTALYGAFLIFIPLFLAVVLIAFLTSFICCCATTPDNPTTFYSKERSWVIKAFIFCTVIWVLGMFSIPTGLLNVSVVTIAQLYFNEVLKGATRFITLRLLDRRGNVIKMTKQLFAKRETDPELTANNVSTTEQPATV